MNRRRTLSLLAAALVAPPLARAQAAAPQRIELHADIGGVRSILLLDLEGDHVNGQLTEQALKLSVRGAVRGRRLLATLKEPITGLTLLRLEGTLHDDGLDATLTPISGAAPVRARFLRTDAAAAQAAAAADGVTSLDPRLVGRWVHQSMISSGGGAGGFASFTTERVLEFAADGRVQQSVRSAGGGGNWSAGSRGEVEFSGRWQARNGELWVARGAAGFELASRYRFAGNYLVTEGNGGKRIWAR